ncbi:unnamed protein product [Somion occarium]|uniref:YMC020W-like alpha/beta hydrolase domain-containing protein n=1 Tax=Somion occarium TaxID=3059160 RepID=A0ABP1CRR7_9APHY
MPRKRERLQSISSAVTLGDQSPPSKEESGSIHKRSRVASIASGSVDPPMEQTTANAEVQGIDVNMNISESPVSDTIMDKPMSDSPETSPIPLVPPETTSTLSVPLPLQETARNEPPTASPPSRSWFSSFSRSKGKEKVSTMSNPVPISTEVPASSVLASQDDQEENRLSSPETGTHALADLGPSQKESTSPTSEETVVPSSVDTHRTKPVSQQLTRAASNAASVSSVDDEVPRPKIWSDSGSTEAAAMSPPSQNTADHKPSINSSSPPTTSGFMLRLPLLGRPKMPLSQVVSAAAGTQSETSNTEPVPSASDSQALKNMSAESETPEPSNQGGLVNRTIPQDPSDQSTPISRQDGSTPSYSWWDYLGLGGNSVGANTVDTSATPTAAQEDAPATDGVPQGSAMTDTLPKPESCPELHVMPATLESITPQQTTTIHTGGTGSETEVPNSPPSDLAQPKTDAAPLETRDRPASLFSSETAKAQGSVWYTPWSWYYGAPAPASTSGIGSEPTTAVDSQSEAITKTESEMVKEEALARDESIHPQIAPQSPEEITSPMEVPNPIESSIATNRSGWASFFMSRALLVKSITNESKDRDENGMEVMNIDDDDEQQVEGTYGAPQSPVTSVTITTTREVTVQPRQQAVPAPVSPPGSPTKPQPSKQREAKKPSSPALPLTNSESIKKEASKPKPVPPRTVSPAPSQKSSKSSPVLPSRIQQPNLVLPTWGDTFHTHPRSYVPPPPKPSKSKLSKTLSFVSHALFASEGPSHGSAKGKEREHMQPEILTFGQELPKALGVLSQTMDSGVLNGDCRVVVIGVAGWSPGAVTRTIAGGLPSSSGKFVDMTCSALERFEQQHDIRFQKITKIPLEGDGTIARKVTKVHAHLLSKPEWIEDLHLADVIFIAAHSQGSIVSIHLLDKLIREGHILTPRNIDILTSTAALIAPGGAIPASTSRTQRICCLALCGIHLGPLRYLKTSSLLQPYIQYFENAAARELFDFQDTESKLSKDYINALRTIMDHGAKTVYVASLNDQVVPIYSGLFTAASHPRILRALYIDGDAYHSSDFLSNLLVLLIRIRNAGLSDSGLLAHLSEATAGTLSGVGHSTAYEELATFSLAVDYLFLTNDGGDSREDLVVDSFNAVNEQNDYEIPWSLRDMIADDRVAQFFAKEFSQLRDAFDDWAPKTTILRDIKRKLQPIQRLSTIKRGSFSKL